MGVPAILALLLSLIVLEPPYCNHSWAVFLFSYLISLAAYMISAYIVPNVITQCKNGAGCQGLLQFMQVLLTAFVLMLFAQSCTRGENCCQQ
jgi:hypothetical protein